MARGLPEPGTDTTGRGDDPRGFGLPTEHPAARQLPSQWDVSPSQRRVRLFAAHAANCALQRGGLPVATGLPLALGLEWWQENNAVWGVRRFQ
jgi:hypothetical protein